MTGSVSTSNFDFNEEIESTGKVFSDFQEIRSAGFNILVKANRNGKLLIMKGVKKEYRDTAVYMEALRKEYDILSSLQHPNIISVEGYEDIEGFGRCIVQEYVSGKNLRDALEAGLSQESKLQIVRELLDAIEYIHKKQIVHRDLKPSNIMIADDGGHVKVIDFGLSDSEMYTFLKQPSGTEAFMSPEQKEVSVSDTRNDIYSLGCIMECMKLGKKYDALIARCKSPIDERYQTIATLRNNINKVEKRSMWKWIASVAAVLVCLILLGVRYHWMDDVYQFAHEIELAHYDFKEDGIYYNVLTDGEHPTVEVTNDGYVDCYKGDYTIPDSVFHSGIWYRVVRIGDDAFSHCSGLEALVLPPSVESMGKNAVLYCRLLATINLPDGITSMGDSCVRNCDRLRSVRLPEGMEEVPPYFLSGCSRVHSLYLPEHLKVIRRDGLAGTGLDSISLPEGLKSIERGAFWACLNLKKVRIPASVNMMGDFIFWHCDSLRDVYVDWQKPLNITNIFQDLKDVTLHVPKGMRELYMKAENWKDLNVVED
ncbi:MAG: leucine-rich repeat protein [Prevotellaceae bacterium]|nr:leucine-rich repeat protein [Candidatus Minthosoma equi]